MVSGLAMLAAMPASAETLESALAKAYQGNPSLNASRAGVRAIDENVAKTTELVAAAHGKGNICRYAG